jgi:hypothetical protein
VVRLGTVSFFNRIAASPKRDSQFPLPAGNTFQMTLQRSLNRHHPTVASSCTAQSFIYRSNSHRVRRLG